MSNVKKAKLLRNKKKLAWKSLELTRIRLSPEQAVLSCCEQSDRAMGGATTSCSSSGYFRCGTRQVALSS